MFKSEAHKRKLAELVTQGKITQADYDAHAKETGKTKLPERLTPKKHIPAPKGRYR